MDFEPHFDEAKGIGPLFPDLLVGGEAGASVDKEGLRVEVGPAALELLVSMSCYYFSSSLTLRQKSKIVLSLIFV